MSLARHTTETNIALCHLTPTQMSIQTYNAVTRTMQSHTSLLPCLRQLKCPQIWPTACSCMSCGVKPHELIAASSTSGSSPFVYDSAHRAGVRRQHKQTCLFLHQRSDKSRTDHDVTAAVELSADVDLGERRPLRVLLSARGAPHSPAGHAADAHAVLLGQRAPGRARTFMPLRRRSSSRMFTVSYGTLSVFRIWTHVLLKPHCGNCRLPFMNSTTLFSDTYFSMASFSSSDRPMPVPGAQVRPSFSTALRKEERTTRLPVAKRIVARYDLQRDRDSAAPANCACAASRRSLRQFRCVGAAHGRAHGRALACRRATGAKRCLCIGCLHGNTPTHCPAPSTPVAPIPPLCVSDPNLLLDVADTLSSTDKHPQTLSLTAPSLC